MTETVEIQPAYEQRRDFARWALSQTPRIETASASTTRVPVALFAIIPEALLVGARIDGTPYRSVIDGLVPEGDGYKGEPTFDEVVEEQAAIQAAEESVVTTPRRTRRGTK